ncbi:DENN domain-containing protein 2B isoform X1 [Dendroctonus ponderosae]|uniref:DENN domain-containing protein 2B isoform X1 n=1 Tax=Dendroctonus ponderosae TaxID=77166 RepID=UPI0020362D61|nr:DENN domain-containing protein 2B isoform X1 [Dendroctonus ponderosae]XP_019771864.2 DENN domain-containing protein 2B isoform X1 [Dendroctonus ponderosae]
MYKPPQNCNRVKSIKSKFESIENQQDKAGFVRSPTQACKYVENNDRGRSALSRQLSDPSRPNIKRTPAFRVDRNCENISNRKTLFENKVKQFNSVKDEKVEKDLSSSEKCCLSGKENVSFLHSNAASKPVLIKSKSSHEFNYTPRRLIESPKPNSLAASTEEPPEMLLQNVDLSLLYTEPIPKSMRNKNPPEPEQLQPKLESIYNKSTLQLTDVDKKLFLESLKKVLKQDVPQGLTDSLKVALKKPLPQGPAPIKPPRTFQHSSSKLPDERKKPGKKADPKYMLNKLEIALKNNKLRTRKQEKAEVSTTSGEDSDDSLLFQSKSCPKGPDFGFSELNCFNSFRCADPAYERIKEQQSSFYVEREQNPIYAEPIQRGLCSEHRAVAPNNRNSLYYMSTALISEDTGEQRPVNGLNLPNIPDIGTKMSSSKSDQCNPLLNQQLSADNSSLSSFTSDLDSTPSPVTDDPHMKIRYLINNFERRRETLPKSQKQAAEKCNSHEDLRPNNPNRVDVLRSTLKETLDKSFASDCLPSGSRDSDSDEGKVARMVARFHTFQKTAPKYQQPQVSKDTLFYCCLVIEKVRDCAQIKFKFPPNVDIPRDIEHLCFPESSDSPPLEGTSAAQTYSLLITSETGDRTYGYCRRVLPEGSNYCLPLAYCILSKYRAPKFYKKILLELEGRHGMQDRFRETLISQFYHKKFPKPGESIAINLSNIGEENLRTPNGIEESLDLTSYIQVNKTGEYALSNSKSTSIFVSESDMEQNATPTFLTCEGNKSELMLTLHPDTRYEDADLKRLHKLPSDILLKIFSSLLLERKVILISSVISELSSCVDALQSILYPFTWYHTFIPILPKSLWDIVESPTPVVCGVLSQEAIEDRHIENGIVVNLDTKSVLVEERDESKILGGSLQKVWRQFITLANNTKSREYVYSVYLADAYLYVFICCFKNYKQYIKNGQFLKEELIKNGKTKGIRRFLKMFTETCMFHAFMDTALNNPDSLAAFDKKIELYGSDESRIILDKLIDWHR